MKIYHPEKIKFNPKLISVDENELIYGMQKHYGRLVMKVKKFKKQMMSYKKPFSEYTLQELNMHLRRFIASFENGVELTDNRLDGYNLLKKRIQELEDSTPFDELSIEDKWKRMYEE